MSVSILEALESAKYNVDNLVSVPSLAPALIPLIKSQLNNAIVLLEKGYDPYQEIEPLLEEYGDVENVPDISE